MSSVKIHLEKFVKFQGHFVDSLTTVGAEICLSTLVVKDYRCLCYFVHSLVALVCTVEVSVDCTSSICAIRIDSLYMSRGLVNENNNNRLGLGETIDRLNDHYRFLDSSCIMSSFLEFIRKMGHRLCSRELPDKFLIPQMALGRDSGDARVFKRMVLKGRLAPFYPGFEDSDAAPGVRISHELVTS